MENVLLFTFILLIAELIEAYIQKAETLFGVLVNLHHYYRKSIFLFFLVQPGFYVFLFNGCGNVSSFTFLFDLTFQPKSIIMASLTH